MICVVIQQVCKKTGVNYDDVTVKFPEITTSDPLTIAHIQEKYLQNNLTSLTRSIQATQEVSEDEAKTIFQEILEEKKILAQGFGNTFYSENTQNPSKVAISETKK